MFKNKRDVTNKHVSNEERKALKKKKKKRWTFPQKDKNHFEAIEIFEGECQRQSPINKTVR